MSNKFHLDLAPVNFSLTEGTSIPAPPDSPPKTPPTAARPPTPGGGPLSSHPATPSETSGTPQESSTQISSTPAVRKTSSAAQTTNPATTTTTTTTTASMPTRSPVPNKKPRPSSVRKFLGLRSLNVSHMKSSDSLVSNSTAPTVQSGRPSNANADHRPLSPNTRNVRRRSSASWFGKRASGFFGGAQLDEVMETGALPREKENGSAKKGPPPPKLPELKTFGIQQDEGSLGGDLFKNIK